MYAPNSGGGASARSRKPPGRYLWESIREYWSTAYASDPLFFGKLVADLAYTCVTFL